jgi:large subunit ribosomal protein L4
MPRKMRRAALRSALSVKAASKDILVLDAIQLDEAKTKAMANILDQLVGSSSALIVLADRNETVEKAVRNLNSAKTLQAGYMNVRDLLGYDRLILSKESIEAIEGYLGTRGGAA